MSHYDDVAAEYEKAFFYSSMEYRDWVLSRLLCHFDLPNKDAELVDIGGGTGNFTQALGEAAQARRRVLCIDPFPEMLAQAVQHEGVEPFLMDAVSFAKLPPGEMSYTHALLKEVVHHIPEEEVPALFAGIAAQLRPGGSVVVITRPQEVDYPLFARAREIWHDHQPHHSLYTTAMGVAGLEVEVAAHDFHATLPLTTWVGMMRSKFWSTFSHCTPQELEQGIAEVEAQHHGKDSVQFVDRLLFLVGRKPAGPLAAGTTRTDGPSDGAPTSNGNDGSSSTAPPGNGGAGSGGTAPGSGSSRSSSQRANPQAGSSAQAFPAVLHLEQLDEYRRDGFTGPVGAMSEAAAAQLYSQFRRYEDSLGGTVKGDWRFKAHLLSPWLWELVHHPALVGAVSEALGGCRNLLCWSTDLFCKEPGDGGYTSWHQDSTYVGLHPPDVLTAWFALTPSGPDNGCLHFLPGSHHSQLPHEDTYAPGNLLLKGQTIQELEASGEQGVAVSLRPGQVTLHHIRMTHRSGPAAATAERRVGIAIRYMAAHVRQELQPRDSVTVVAGRDTFGLYVHEKAPAAPLDAAALEEHRRAVSRVYPDGYVPPQGQGAQ